MKKFFIQLSSIIIIFVIFHSPSYANAQNEVKKEGDVIIIGDAIYNFFIKCSSEKQCSDFRKLVHLDKSGHTLLDIKQKRELEERIKAEKADSFSEIAVGSATNTIKVITKLGGKTAFIGNVGDDKAGADFKQNITNYGIKHTKYWRI